MFTLLCSHYQVAVVILPAGTEVDSLQSPDMEFPDINGRAYDATFCDRAFTSPFVYVTAEFAAGDLPSDRQFVIGKAGEPNDVQLYTNGLLCNAKRYTFFLRAYTAVNSATVRSFRMWKVRGREVVHE